MPKIAVYPGSFDPITKGHVNIIERSLTLFDQVIVLVSINQTKKYLLSLQERMELINKVFNGVDRLVVKSYQGLTVKFAQEQGAQFLIRGLRINSDCDHEFQLAGMNRQLDPNIETVWLPAMGEWAPISSTIVREIVALGGDISAFVPNEVVAYLTNKSG